MSDLLRRLEKLESQVNPTDCVCKKRSWSLRFEDHDGTPLPDLQSHYPQKAPISCPVHGEVAADEMVIRSVKWPPT